MICWWSLNLCIYGKPLKSVKDPGEVPQCGILSGSTLLRIFSGHSHCGHTTPNVRSKCRNGTEYNKNETGGMKWNWAEQMEQENWGGRIASEITPAVTAII